MSKTIEIETDGKLVKFSGRITKMDDDTVSFSLFNECGDKWEWGLMRPNGTEHYMPDVSAVGLIFNKVSAKGMAQILRYIADTLEEYK